jgi:hypothetical protein
MAVATLGGVVLAAPVVARDARRNRAVSARVILPSRHLVAGSTMQATIRVQNDTGSALSVSACGSPFQVALSNDKIQPHLGWLTCGMTFTIPVGKSTYPAIVAGTYVSCGGGGPDPACVDGRPPPLPPGKCQAKLYQSPEIVRAPTPITVQVTRRRR